MRSQSSDRRRMVNRREFIRLVGVGGGATFLVACASRTPTPQTQNGAAASAGQRVTVTFWTPGGSDVYCQGFETIAQNFEALNEGIDIGEAQCGTGEQDFNQVLLSRIAAGDPPDATILWTSPAALGARGSLLPLDDLMATSQYSQLENWPQGVLASCQFGGSTYGLPATAGAYAVFYNAEMFEERGIPTERESFPKTLAELRQLSKEFTHWEGDTLQTAGFIPLADPGSFAVHLAYWSALNGSQLYDSANQQYTINAEPNIELMQFFVDWINEEYQGDYSQVLQSGVWSGYEDEQGRPPAFQEGRQAMLEQGFWYTGDFYASIEPVFTKWDVAQFPVAPNGKGSVSGYWPNWLAIPQGSSHPEEAFRYLDYLGAKGIEVWFANVPDLPANKLVSNDLMPTIVVEKRGEEFAEDMMRFFRGQLDVATPMWNSPIQNFADDQITAAVDKVMNQVATPEEALTEAQNACQAELEKVLQGS